ncbi:hypothetical protein SAMN05444157_0806 [Frankineae bacterium MT45]|nr:hypothetical protein SAMN05444157_0806 [Frankineae bacterium MT45]
MTGLNDFDTEVRQLLKDAAADQAARTDDDALASRIVAAAMATKPATETYRTRRGGRIGLNHWGGPLLAAAAVVLIAVILAATLSIHHSDHSLPVAPPTTRQDVPTPTASASPTRAAPSSGASIAAPPRATPQATPAVALKEMTIQVGNPGSVTLMVPTSWHLSKTQPKACCEEPASRCLVAGSDDFNNNPENCLLTVSMASAYAVPDLPRPVARDACARKISTTSISNAPVQGRPAEYRRFLNQCTGTSSEMWTTMSDPEVMFWHPITDRSTTAQVSTILRTAVLPTVIDAHRTFDEGILRGVSKKSDGYHVIIDRIVWAPDGTLLNANPQTYDYLVTFWSPPRLTKIASCDHPGYGESCPVDALLTQFQKGPHPADGSSAIAGQYTQLVHLTGNDYELLFFTPTRAS